MGIVLVRRLPQKKSGFLLAKATSLKYITVPGYTDKNGRYVPPHQKKVHYNPDHSHSDVLSGKGSHSQKIAIKKLSKNPNWQDLDDGQKVAHVLSSATNIQKKASFGAAISGWKKSALEGKNPSPAQWKAFYKLDSAKKAELHEEVLSVVGGTDHLSAPPVEIRPDSEKDKALQDAIDHLEEDSKQSDIPSDEKAEDAALVETLKDAQAGSVTADDIKALEGLPEDRLKEKVHGLVEKVGGWGKFQKFISSLREEVQGAKPEAKTEEEPYFNGGEHGFTGSYHAIQYYSEIADKVKAKAEAGDIEGLKKMPFKSGKTWAGKTKNSKILVALYEQALKDAEGKSKPKKAPILELDGNTYQKVMDGWLNTESGNISGQGSSKFLALSILNGEVPDSDEVSKYSNGAKNAAMDSLVGAGISVDQGLKIIFPAESFSHGDVVEAAGSWYSLGDSGWEPVPDKQDEGQPASAAAEGFSHMKNEKDAYTWADGFLSQFSGKEKAKQYDELIDLFEAKGYDYSKLENWMYEDAMDGILGRDYLPPEDEPGDDPMGASPASSNPWSDEEWSSLYLDPSNTNAKSHAKKIDALKAAAEKGDIDAIKGMKFGSNSYGKKQAKIAEHLVSDMSSALSAASPADMERAPTWSVEHNDMAFSGSSSVSASGLSGDVVYAAWVEEDGTYEVGYIDADGNPEADHFEFVNDAHAKLMDLAKEKGVSTKNFDAASLIEISKGPQEGDTKQGADGILVFKDGRWHKQGDEMEELNLDPSVDGWLANVSAGKVPTKEQAAAINGMNTDLQNNYYAEAVEKMVSAKLDFDKTEASIWDAAADDAYAQVVKLHMQAQSPKKDSPPDDAPPPAPKAKAVKVTLTNTEGSHNKFWSVYQDGSKLVKQWGKVGTNGQTQTQEFANSAAAKASMNLQMDAKIKKGYEVADQEPIEIDTTAEEPKVQGAPEPKTQAGPEIINNWQEVGGQDGFNPGGYYKDANGDQWYVKFPAGGLDVIKNEILAGKLYAAAGVKVPEVKLVSKSGKTGIASRIVTGAKKDKEKLLAGKAKGLLSGFAADAWLANWDVVGNNPASGKGWDNIIFKGDEAYRIDNGGSLLYGGAGGKKSKFGETVIELDTMLDPKKNSHTAAVFGKMSTADITASAASVVSISDDTIHALVNEYGPGSDFDKNILAKKLIARKNDIAAKYPAAAKKAKPKSTAFKPATKTKGSGSLDWVQLNPGEKIVESGEQFGVEFAKIEVPPKGFSVESIPKPYVYDKSSKAWVNESNTADIQKIYQLATSGAPVSEIAGMKFEQVDKESGNKTGKLLSIDEHPSKAWLKEYHTDVMAELKAQLEPTYRNVHNGSFASSYSNAAAFIAKRVKSIAYDKFKSWKDKAADYLVLDRNAGDAIPAPEPGQFHDVEPHNPEMVAFKKASDTQHGKLSASEKSALKAYTGTAYYKWNSALREGDVNSSEFAGSQKMREAFDKAAVELPEGIVLHRGLSVGYETYKSVMGAVIQDGSFQSCSYGKKAAFSGQSAQLRLHITRGVKGMMATSFSKYGAGEREIILERNCRYLVMSAKKEGHQTYVDVLVLPHEEK